MHAHSDLEDAYTRIPLRGQRRDDTAFAVRTGFPIILVTRRSPGTYHEFGEEINVVRPGASSRGFLRPTVESKFTTDRWTVTSSSRLRNQLPGLRHVRYAVAEMHLAQGRPLGNWSGPPPKVMNE